MAIQELDLVLHYKPGRVNQKADALSRSPCHPDGAEAPLEERVIATIESIDPQASAKGGESSLESLQREDVALLPYFTYLEQGILPTEDHVAKELVLTRDQYEILDGVLYHIEKDKTLRVIPPCSSRKKLFDEAHSGKFAGHLRSAKIHSLLSRHYWWKGMRRDIQNWCQACLTCATRDAGRAVRPPLMPISVSGPFDRIGVDVVQFPKSKRGNKYAIVFVDYLTKWVEVFATPDQSALTIAKLLVEEIISRHGVPRELLSDRGAAFCYTRSTVCWGFTKSRRRPIIRKLMGLLNVFTGLLLQCSQKPLDLEVRIGTTDSHMFSLPIVAVSKTLLESLLSL